MSKPSSELREAIAQRLTEASAVGGVIYPNSTLVDAILDAVIASLPEYRKGKEQGLYTGVHLQEPSQETVFNVAVDTFRSVLQSAKSISKESER